MTYSAQYRNKRRTAQEAAGLVRSGDWVDYGFALNMPVAFDEALAARSGEIDDVKIRGTLALKPSRRPRQRASPTTAGTSAATRENSPPRGDATTSPCSTATCPSTTGGS